MIYFPGRCYDLIGGAEILILNIAQGLAYNDERIGLIGKNEYPLIKVLEEKQIPFTFIDDNHLDELQMTDEDLLIIFTYSKDLSKIQCNPKVIVWNILSYSLINWNTSKLDSVLRFLSDKPVLWRINRHLVRRLCEKRALFFMDASTFHTTEHYFKLKLSPNYLPIPIAISDYRYKNKPGSTLSITYLGRGDEVWKIYPLMKVLRDIDLNCNKDIALNIITQDTRNFGRLLKSSSGITIKYHTGLYGNRLRDFLASVSDLHFAMGTSALEAAILGIPTILLDASYSPFPESYRYKWLHETNTYNLGCDLAYLKDFGTHTFNDIIADIFDDETRGLLSRRCYRYAKENHRIDKTLELIKASDSQMRLNDFTRYFKEKHKSHLVGSLERLFSINF